MRTLTGLAARTGLVLLLPALAGCGGAWSDSPGAGRPLRIATTWPGPQRERLEQEFREWVRDRGQAGGAGPVRLAWIEIPAPPDPRRPDSVLPRADVLLGGPLVEYVRLARLGAFGPPGEGKEVRCLVLRTRSVVLTGGPPVAGEPVALDDPRSDPATLAWCVHRLKAGPWPEGYAGLVRLAGRCVAPMGWLPGTARAAVERGEARHAAELVFDPPGQDAAAMPEGAAVLAGSGGEPLAAEFLRFLARRRGASPMTEADAPDPDVNDLLADLLGSTLADAEDELGAAWAALGGVDAATPSPALAWMTEPPPWPPASVEKLLVRGGDRGLILAHDLAGQLAADPELRFWLVQSWLRPRRPVDLSLLGELARAGGGRLVREPRFRSWLRSEWGAWARQRYRRVARLVAAAVPPAPR